jgi:hypothetical protein
MTPLFIFKLLRVLSCRLPGGVLFNDTAENWTNKASTSVLTGASIKSVEGFEIDTCHRERWLRNRSLHATASHVIDEISYNPF